MPIPRTTQRRSQPQLTSQAQINAVLRYAPERQALAQAVQEARTQHSQDIAGAQSEARLNQSAVAQSGPAVASIYDHAAQTSAAARAALATTLAGLGSAAAPFQAAAATEGAVGAEKTANEAASAKAQNVAQALAIHAAPAFARTLADNRLGTTLSKILASTEGVAGQEGLATASEAQREAKEAQARRLTERGQNITAQSDAEGHAIAQEGNQITAKHYAESGNTTPGGVKQQPTEKQAQAAGQIRTAEDEARSIVQHARSTGVPINRGKLLAELTVDQPAHNTPKKDENGNVIRSKGKYGQPGDVQYETVPGQKAIPKLLAEAALDSIANNYGEGGKGYGYGRVSKATLEKLHNAGYSLKELGLQGPAPPKPAYTAPPAGRANERRTR